MNVITTAEKLKAMGDPTRLQIVMYLVTGERCVSEFVSLLSISQPAVSKHLIRLKTAGIVAERRQGMRVYYSINRQTIRDMGVHLLSLAAAVAVEEINELQ